MSDELERICYKAIVAQSKYYTVSCLDGPSKTIKPQESRCPDRESSQAPTKYKSRTLSLQQPTQSNSYSCACAP
jgi:hypothetical protein